MSVQKFFDQSFFAVIVLFFLSFNVLSQASVPYLTQPSISPDNSEIVFISGGDIWSVPSSGGTAQILVSHPATEGHPIFSPDGKKLAFTSNRSGNTDIYVLEFATNNLTRVTYSDGADNLDAWSPDGEWLYFHSNSQDIAGMNDIFRVRPEGGTPMPVSNDRYTNEFFSGPSPDGSGIIFSARGNSNSQWWRNGSSHLDESEIWLKKGDTYTQISERGSKQQWPMWNSEGTMIYYVSDRSGNQNIWSQRLNADAKQVTNFQDGRVLWAKISYDGKEIVFERDFQIWKMNTTNGETSQLPVTLRGSVGSPIFENKDLSGKIKEFALSPDGKKVVGVAHGEIFAGAADEGGEAVRVTNTAAPESNASWSHDSKKIAYSSERDGELQLFEYDFATETESQLTKTGKDYLPVYSTDGKYIAFIRNGREIWLYDLKKKKERKLSGIYTNLPPLTDKRTFTWSPDNKWIAFLTLSPENRSYTNVSVVSVESGDVQPISFIANSSSGTISWSPDGEYILFDTNQRTETPSLAKVSLKLGTPVFNEDKFRGLFEPENPQPDPSPNPENPVVEQDNVSTPNSDSSEESEPVLQKDAKKEKNKPVEIDFEDIRKRLDFINTGVEINEHAISPDGKTLLVTASAEGQFNLYTINLDQLAKNRSPKQITSTPTFKFDAQFSPKGDKVYYLESGSIKIVNLAKENTRSLPVNMSINVNFAEEKMEIFEQGWRYMRDHFYDPNFHGVDWDSVYKTYEPLVRGSQNIEELRRLMNMMVGELNASHLGVSGPNEFKALPVGRLGLRFDRSEYENKGQLKISEVIDLSPSAVSEEIKEGDYLLSVDKVEITGSTNINKLLESKVDKRVEIEIASSANGAGKRTVVLKPVSTGAEKQLLYRQWVEDNREYVERISGGKLGYIHLPDMSANTLSQVYVDLDVQNQNKQGVVVDIRNNNGGFINPYVIDIFSRKGYLTMEGRGLWETPARSALGQRSLERPTILVTNQHSLSDAEDLTEAYRELEIGKVVGEKTSGWIIFTWNTQLFDGTSLRLPRTKITDNAGQNMELNSRPVDVEITRPIGETMTEKDSQLDVAVRELLDQIEKE